MQRADLMCMTVQEVADRLKVTRKTIYRLIRKGSLSATHVGGAVRITEEALDSYLRENTVIPSAAAPQKVKKAARLVAGRKYRYF